MYNRLTDFVNKKEIQYEKQFGFHSNHSIDHAILSIILLKRFNYQLRRKATPVEYSLTFKKAFDTVDHSILIKKLDKLGIRGLANKWFVSYLTNRKQYIYLR